MPTINSILITRKPGSFENLEQWCFEKEIQLTEIPFIKIQPILGVEIPLTDWIFFSSPQGAQLYLKHYSIKAQKIAAFGQGTASVLKKSGLQVDFIGDAIDDPEIIGQKFNAILNNDSRVFFPIGNRSKRSVINEIAAKQLVEFITYKTLDHSQKLLAKFDAILFTSPSNFQNFAELNNLVVNTRLIAMGKTTEKAMRSFNPKLDIKVLETPNEKALLNYLEKLL